MLADDRAWVNVWRSMTDAELENSARAHAWLAEDWPEAHAKRRDQIFVECELRGRGDIVERAREYAVTTPAATVA